MRRVVPTTPPRDPLVQDVEVLGQAIRAARTGSGVTLTDAAMALGISKQTLSDLETAPSSVGLGIAVRVARELGVALFAVPAAERQLVRRAIEAARGRGDGPPAAREAAGAAKPGETAKRTVGHRQKETES